jgi:hypothetical protein
VTNIYDDKLKDITGSGQLARQKQALVKLKLQVRQLSRNEGVMLSTLYGCGGMRHGNHHLNDEIEIGVDPKVTSQKDNPKTKAVHADDDIRDEDFD